MRSRRWGRVMAKIGYARVSTRGQNDDSQVDDLTAYGCEKIFTDTASGKHAARPELDKALAYLRAGDVFVITRLSRAMRSLKHLLTLADELRDRGVGLVVLKQQIDTTTPQGRLVFHLLGAIDEFQRELIVEGTREGLDAARARGRTGGRKPKLNARQAATVRRMYQATGPDGKRQHTVAEIAEAVGVHRTTVYDYIRKERLTWPAASRTRPATPGRSSAACCSAATSSSTPRPRSSSPQPSRPRSKPICLPGRRAGVGVFPRWLRPAVLTAGAGFRRDRKIGGGHLATGMALPLWPSGRLASPRGARAVAPACSGSGHPAGEPVLVQPWSWCRRPGRSA